MTDNGEAIRYRASDLINYAAALFARAGCDGDKPATIAAGLVEADLLGHTRTVCSWPPPIWRRWQAAT